MIVRDVELFLVPGLFIEDSVMLAEKEMLQKIVGGFDRILKSEMMKGNTGKSNV